MRTLFSNSILCMSLFILTPAIQAQQTTKSGDSFTTCVLYPMSQQVPKLDHPFESQTDGGLRVPDGRTKRPLGSFSIKKVGERVVKSHSTNLRMDLFQFISHNNGQCYTLTTIQNGGGRRTMTTKPCSTDSNSTWMISDQDTLTSAILYPPKNPTGTVTLLTKAQIWLAETDRSVAEKQTTLMVINGELGSGMGDGKGHGHVSLQCWDPTTNESRLPRVTDYDSFKSYPNMPWTAGFKEKTSALAQFEVALAKAEGSLFDAPTADVNEMRVMASQYFNRNQLKKNLFYFHASLNAGNKDKAKRWQAARTYADAYLELSDEIKKRLVDDGFILRFVNANFDILSKGHAAAVEGLKAEERILRHDDLGRHDELRRALTSSNVTDGVANAHANFTTPSQVVEAMVLGKNATSYKPWRPSVGGRATTSSQFLFAPTTSLAMLEFARDAPFWTWPKLIPEGGNLRVSFPIASTTGATGRSSVRTSLRDYMAGKAPLLFVATIESEWKGWRGLPTTLTHAAWQVLTETSYGLEVHVSVACRKVGECRVNSIRPLVYLDLKGRDFAAAVAAMCSAVQADQTAADIEMQAAEPGTRAPQIGTSANPGAFADLAAQVGVLDEIMTATTMALTAGPMKAGLEKIVSSLAEWADLVPPQPAVPGKWSFSDFFKGNLFGEVGVSATWFNSELFNASIPWGTGSLDSVPTVVSLEASLNLHNIVGFGVRSENRSYVNFIKFRQANHLAAFADFPTSRANGDRIESAVAIDEMARLSGAY